MKTDEWESWQWQLSNSIRNLEDLKKELNLLEEEKIENVSNQLALRITPYYLDLIKKNPILRKTVVPTLNEMVVSSDELEDPLEEDKYKHGCTIHKYPDRCLFLITNSCSTYCRYCTRSRIVGGHENFSKRDIDDGIEYIKNHPEIRDVILSGGDPLTMSDGNLEWILQKLRTIKTIEIIRIGTKIPVVLPMRVTTKLCDMLKKYHPLYMSLHFSHPNEITSDCAAACNKLADVGIVLRSQTVLLKGVNDNIDTMKELMHKLLTIRVSPYYIYYPDYIIGSSHFRPSIDVAIDIIKQLRKTTSGYAVPTLIFDTKYGKIAVNPENILKNNDTILILKSSNDEIIEFNK